MDGVYDDRRYPGHRLQTLSLCWPSLPRYMLSLKNSLPDGYRGPMSHMRKSGSRRHERGHTAWVSRIRPFIRHSLAGGSGRVVVGLGIGSPLPNILPLSRPRIPHPLLRLPSGPPCSQDPAGLSGLFIVKQLTRSLFSSI